MSGIGDHGGRTMYQISHTDFVGNDGGETVCFVTGVATFEDCHFTKDLSTKATIYMSPNDISSWYEGSGGTAGRLTLIDCSFAADIEPQYANVYVSDGYSEVAKSTTELKGTTSATIYLTDGHFLYLYGTHTGAITIDEATDPETNIVFVGDATLNGATQFDSE